MTRTLPPAAPDQSPPTANLPRHRVILAVDIEQSTSRPDQVKAELRRTLYELFDQALQSAGIRRHHRDRFTDRGDGLLALIHPVDQAAKPVLLGQVVPALSQLLADYNASLPSAGHTGRQLRVRIVMHAGEVHYDSNGCSGHTNDRADQTIDPDLIHRGMSVYLIGAFEYYLDPDCQVLPNGSSLVELSDDTLGVVLSGKPKGLRNARTPLILTALPTSGGTPVQFPPVSEADGHTPLRSIRHGTTLSPDAA